MQWLRLYHDTPNDPKWRKVAVRSNQPVGNVLAVWTMMLVNASEAAERGKLEDWDDETAAAILGYPPDAVAAIRLAMQGVVLDGNTLTGWAKRQKASDNTAERMRRMRAKNTHDNDENGGDGGNSSAKANGAKYRNGDGGVTSHPVDVTSRSDDVTSRPSRASDSQIEEDSDASASAPPAVRAAPPSSLKTKLFNECLTWLIATTKRQENSLRAKLSTWIRDYGEGAVLEAVTVAQRESAVSPVGFIEKVLQRRGGKNGQANGSDAERLKRGLARAFSDQLDPGPADSGGQGRAVAPRYH